MSFERLVKLWAERDWDPCPKPKTIEEVWSMDDAGTLPGGPGTWDELVAMRDYRELSDDEYVTILRAKIAVATKGDEP